MGACGLTCRVADGFDDAAGIMRDKSKADFDGSGSHCNKLEVRTCKAREMSGGKYCWTNRCFLERLREQVKRDS
jgi:hypothetical protein